jgi:hypothetical protein
MYIVAIAWLYVAFMMAITSESVLGGIAVFLFYGLLPCSLVMYLLGAPARKKAIKAKEAKEAEQANAITASEEKITPSE